MHEPGEADPEEAEPEDAYVPEGPRYPVSDFELVYFEEHPGQFDLDELAGVVIRLGYTEEGLVAPEEVDTHIELVLGDPPAEAQFFYGSAIRSVCSQIVEAFNRRGLIGVYVFVCDEHISRFREDGEFRDLRDDDSLRLLAATTTVGEVRTVASGDRVDQEDRINSRTHRRIRAKSPLQQGDLLREKELDRYIFRLNRHPARSVSTAVSAADEPGRAVLDYLVAEGKPWLAYLQVSNTGTKATNEWQQRLGVSHTQLTGRDDILSLDYVTTAFDEVHFALGSYTMPVKWLSSNFRLYGRWNKYTASEVGRAEQDFKGRGWQAGSELAWTLFQRGPLFLDFYGGARWEETEVENVMFDIKGRDSFLLPYLGLRLERNTRRARTGADISVEHNLSRIAGTDEEEIERLGRFPVDKDWTVLQWRARHSFFLEPLLFRKTFMEMEHDRHRRSSLAHCLALEFSGQHAFGDRLIPQAQRVIGGAYSVRGYPESLTAGDDVYVLRTEYRYHVPRAFRPDDQLKDEVRAFDIFGRQFRYGPQHFFGQPDWDLVLKAFFDYGRALYSEREFFEEHRTLMGAGLGIELELLRNLSARVEWGQALRSFEGAQEVRRGNDQVHFGLTLMY